MADNGVQHAAGVGLDMSLSGVNDGENGQIQDLYEERQTPHAGIGIFAVTTIPAGTQLLCEDHLIRLPDDADVPDLYRAVIALSADSQAAFWALAGTKKKHDVDWIATLRRSYDGPSEGFEGLCDRHEAAWEIYETNRFTVRSAGGNPDHMGLFAKAARMNHSCAPNVFHRYNYELKRLTVYSLRTIEPGEEILTSYIDICHPTVERRRILRHWGFKCRCSACISKDNKQDLRRRKLGALMGRMKRTELERLEESWEAWDYAKALTTVEEVIALMIEDDMEETDTLSEAYANAAEYAMALGWWPKARDWAGRVLRIDEKCCGRQSPEYGKALVLVEAAKEGP